MDMHSISVWFVCKLCGYTFHFQNVSEFLEHKRQKHYKEFVKIQCIVFKENDDDSHDAVEPVPNTDMIDVDGDEIDLHKEEFKFILTPQQEPLPSDLINSNRDNRDFVDPKIFSSYVRVKRLARKESETAKSESVKEKNKPGIPSGMISESWKCEIQTSQANNSDDTLDTHQHTSINGHSNSAPTITTITTNSNTKRNRIVDNTAAGPNDDPNSPDSDSDLLIKTKSVHLKIMDAVDPSCSDGDSNQNNISPHLRLDSEACIDLELNFASKRNENKCIDFSADDSNDIQADNEPANHDHYDLSAEPKPEAQLLENFVDEKGEQGTVRSQHSPYVLLKRLHLTYLLAAEPVKETVPNFSDADDCDHDPTYGPQSEINSDSDNSIEREPPTKKRRQSQKSPHSKKRIVVNHFKFPLQETHSEGESNVVMTLSDWLISLKSEPLICTDIDGRKDVTTTSKTNVILLDPDPTSETVDEISVDSPIKCRLCCAKLTSEQQLKIHVKYCWAFNKSRHRHCLICDKTLSQPTELRRHKVTRHGTDKEKARPKLFECQVCSRKLVSRQNFRLHMNTHVNRSERLRPFVCKTCGKSYSYNIQLKYHLLGHAKTLFKCSHPNCTRTYTIPHNLRVHMKLHLKSGQKIRPYTRTQPFIFPPESTETSGPLNGTLSDWLKEQKSNGNIDSGNVILLDPDPTINDIGPITEENPILCKLCYKKLLSESEVRVHVQNCWLHNKNRHRHCALCNRTFREYGSFRIHNVNVHGTEEQKLSRLKFKCDQCPKKFRSREAFKLHVVRCHKGIEEEVRCRAYMCEICGSRFRRPFLLAQHLRTHNDDRPFKCTHLNCSLAFKSKSNLRVHLRTHSDLRNYKCSYKDCNKTFKTRSAVTSHFKSHEVGVKEQYPCTHDNCGKILSSSKSLKGHVLCKHPSEGEIVKPFECETCGKKFRLKICLRRHAVVHKEDKPFQCTEEGCSAAFKFSINLIEHKRIHTGEQPYQCDTCGKAYSKLWSFLKHMRVHTNSHNQHSCHLCPRKFPGSWELKQHLLIHEKGKQFVCQQCGQQCMTKANLVSHEKSHSKLSTAGAGKRGKSRKHKKNKRDTSSSEAEGNE